MRKVSLEKYLNDNGLNPERDNPLSWYGLDSVKDPDLDERGKGWELSVFVQKEGGEQVGLLETDETSVLLSEDELEEFLEGK